MKRILIIGIMALLLICLSLGTACAGTYQTVNEAVTGIIAEMNAAGITGQYNQAVWLHDWLTRHANYDESNTWFSPAGVLLHGTGVCQSYTDAYALLLTAAGIDNTTVICESMDHSWNVVKLDGKWCYVDVTWDDPTGGGKENHFYFGMNAELFSRDHILVNPPYACTTLDNYYPLRNNEGVLMVRNKAEMIQKLNDVIPTHPAAIRLNYYGTDPNFSVVETFVEWANSVNYQYGILGFNADYHNFLATFTMEYTDPWEKQETVLEDPVTIDPFTMEGPAGTYRLSNYKGNGVVLVFGRENCSNTRAFLKGFRREVEGLASVGVEILVNVFNANGVEDILSMEATLAENGVNPGYNLLYDQIGVMWNYLHAVGFDTTTSVSFPCVFLINASGQIVSYSTGHVGNMTEIITSAYALGTGKPLPKPEQINPHEIENGSGNVSQLSGNSQISAIQSAVGNGKYVIFLSNKEINYNNTQSFLESWERKYAMYDALGIELLVALEDMTDGLQSTYPHVQFVNYSEADFWSLLQNEGFSGGSPSYLCNFFYSPDGHCIAYSNGSTLSLNTCALYVSEEKNCPINGHMWGDPVYVWSDDNSTVTATRTCAFDSSHFETETVNTSRGEEIPATCEDPCVVVYTSVPFENEAFIQQEKQIVVSEPLGHDWDEPVYTWSEDNSTITATHICLRDNTHEESETVEVSEEIIVEPTCELSGTAKYTSSAFENTDFEIQIKILSDIEPLGHDWDDPVYIWADENNAVTATRICKRDNSHVETETISASAEVIKMPTCESMGKTKYTSGNFENDAFTVQTEIFSDIDALGHDWDDTIYTWSNDKREVTASRKCRNDQSHIETETVDTSSKVVLPATCETKGKTKYTSAEFENEEFDVQVKTVTDIPALGHEWKDSIYEWADDNQSVTATRICNRDPSHFETETVTATSEIVNAATCETMGKTEYTSAAFENPAFSVQSKTLTDIDALGHAWGTPTYLWADDNSSVTATHVCGNDNTHIETETIAATSEITTPATCEGKGITTYTSSAFNNTAFSIQEKSLENIPALSHIWGNPVYVWANDNSSVTATRTCSRDHSHIETETVATSHEITLPATCESMGKTKYTSAAFENPAFTIQTKTVTNIDALGHSWDTTAYIWADDNSTVTATRICGNDDKHVETETVNVSSAVVKHATCENKGKTKYTGSAFENTAFTVQTKTLEDIEPIGHDWGIASYAWADDNSSVTATRTCGHDSSHVETETVTATSEIKLQPSCESMGKTKYTSAAFENEAFTIQTKTLTNIEALGHDWKKPVYTWADDKSTVTASRTCKNDTDLDHVETETVSVTATITKPATCEFRGTTKYQSAEFENEEFTVQVKTLTDIPALGHDWGDPEYSWADDNRTVTAIRVCGNDNSHVETEDATVTVEITMPATCEEKGQTTYTGAAYLNEAFSAQTKTLTDIDAIGHSWNTVNYNWANDMSTVTALRTCRNDSSHVETETVNVSTEVTTPATCEYKGTTKYTSAEFKNKDFTVQSRSITDIPALGHDWGTTEYSWADDNSAVTAARICRNDATHVDSETVEVTAEITTPATCEDKGKTTYTSKTFEKRYFEIQTKTLKNIDALGHMPVIDEAVEATCTKTGLTEGSHCGVCGKILTVQEVLPIINHHYAIYDAIPATCEETGLTSHVECTECGDIFIAGNEIPALGHDWGEITYTWSQDNKTVTASRICSRDTNHIDSETVNTYRLAVTSPSQTEEGLYKWVSNKFTDDDFVVQEAEGDIIPALQTMTVMNLPAFLTTIETEAFDGIAAEAIIVPDSITTIEPKAFTNCKNLKYIKIPAGVTIPEDAFSGSPKVVIDQR